VDLFESLEARGVARCLAFSDPASGLRAFVVLDDLTLGPAAGGVRTRRYPSTEDALADAARLARAMTLKCALAGLDAGGGKAVVLDHPGLDRKQAFERLGRHVEELGGLLHTAGDLGTTAEDLAAMARRTRYVNTNGGSLLSAAARGLVGCLQACVAVHGEGSMRGLRVAIQGCGGIGAALARSLARLGARLLVSDVVPERAEALAGELGADSVDPELALLADVDVIAPCAGGGVITPEVANNLRAWAVCGGANNQLSGPEAARIMAARGVLHVPDIIASAGAVIEGSGRPSCAWTTALP
jgi:leucine dehydrogenase